MRNVQIHEKGITIKIDRSKDSNLTDEVRIGAIVRKNKVMMPKSTSVFEKNDIEIVFYKSDKLK